MQGEHQSSDHSSHCIIHLKVEEFPIYHKISLIKEYLHLLHLTIRNTSRYSEFLDRNKSTNNAAQPSSPFSVSVQNKQGRTACTVQVLHSIDFILLEGTNKTLCTPQARRKEQWPHKRPTETRPWVSRSLGQSHGLAVASCRVGGTEGNSACPALWTFRRRSPLSSLPPP